MTPAVLAAPPALAAPVWRQILRLAWPALLQQGLLLAIQLNDQYLAGPFSDPHKAALTTANYVYWFVTSYAVVVNAGATALVGRLAGARDWTAAGRATGQAVLLAAAFGLAGGVAGLVGMPAFVELLGLDAAGAGYAVEYLRPLAALLPFYMVEVGGIACLVGAGDTRTGLKVLAAVVLTNGPVAWALSRGIEGFVPNLGFVGIAVGTGLAHVVGCVLVLAVLARGRYGVRLTWPDLMPNDRLIRRLLRVSAPAAADAMSVGVFQFVFLGLVNRLGETAASAHGIAIRLEGLGYLSGAAFATATAAIVSRSLGAGRPDVAARGAWTALAFACGLMTGMGVLFFALARPMFLLFNPAGGPVVEAGVPVLRLIAFAMPGLAGTIVLTQALRGAGDTRVPVLFTWAGFAAVRLPLAWWLTTADAGPHLELIGAWLAMFTDIYVRATFYLARFAGGRWQRVRV